MRDPLREEMSLPAPSSWRVFCFQILFVLSWRWSTPNSIKVTGLHNSLVFPLHHKERKLELPTWSPPCKEPWSSCWIHHGCNVDDWYFPDQRILWHFFVPDAVKRFTVTCVSWWIKNLIYFCLELQTWEKKNMSTIFHASRISPQDGSRYIWVNWGRTVLTDSTGKRLSHLLPFIYLPLFLKDQADLEM